MLKRTHSFCGRGTFISLVCLAEGEWSRGNSGWWIRFYWYSMPFVCLRWLFTRYYDKSPITTFAEYACMFSNLLMQIKDEWCVTLSWKNNHCRPRWNPIVRSSLLLLSDDQWQGGPISSTTWYFSSYHDHVQTMFRPCSACEHMWTRIPSACMNMLLIFKKQIWGLSCISPSWQSFCSPRFFRSSQWMVKVDCGLLSIPPATFFSLVVTSDVWHCLVVTQADPHAET